MLRFMFSAPRFLQKNKQAVLFSYPTKKQAEVIACLLLLSPQNPQSSIHAPCHTPVNQVITARQDLEVIIAEDKLFAAIHRRPENLLNGQVPEQSGHHEPSLSIASSLNQRSNQVL